MAPSLRTQGSGAGVGAAGSGSGEGSSSAGALGTAGEATLEQPWVEKYRPRTVSRCCSQSAHAAQTSHGHLVCCAIFYPCLQLDHVQGNPDIIERLKVIAAEGNMPNIIVAVRLRPLPALSSSPLPCSRYTCISRLLTMFYDVYVIGVVQGPPGTGKTTSVMALARALLGDVADQAVLELNASDDRGIDVVRNRIKMFAQKKVTLPPGLHKVIILDEADSMTSAAQQALRRTMELYSSTTRFALACNNSSKIIEPIQSRCAILRFGRLSNEHILARLKLVCDAESVPFTEDGMAALLFTAEGDMRNALNNLQSTAAGFGLVNDANVYKVCDQPHPTVVKEVVGACVSGNVATATQRLNVLWDQGYAASDIIGTVFRVVRTFEMNEQLKLFMIREVGFVQMRIADGVTTRLQLLGLCAKLSKLGEMYQQSMRAAGRR